MPIVPTPHRLLLLLKEELIAVSAAGAWSWIAEKAVVQKGTLEVIMIKSSWTPTNWIQQYRSELNWTLLSSVEDRGSKCLKRGREQSPTMSLAFFLRPISLSVDVCGVPATLQALIVTSEGLFSDRQFKWPHRAGRQKVKTLSKRLLYTVIFWLTPRLIVARSGCCKPKSETAWNSHPVLWWISIRVDWCGPRFPQGF